MLGGTEVCERLSLQSHMEDILTNAFLVKRQIDFLPGQRTVIIVSDSCFNYTPFRMHDKQILKDVLLFSTEKVDKLFSSTGVGDFLVQDEILASTSKFPRLSGKMRHNHAKTRISSMPCHLSPQMIG